MRAVTRKGVFVKDAYKRHRSAAEQSTNPPEDKEPADAGAPTPEGDRGEAGIIQQQVRQARLRAGVSRRRLSQVLGISRNTLRLFENGGNISLDHFCRIVRYVRAEKITLDGVTYIRADAVERHSSDLLRKLAARMRAAGATLSDLASVAAGNLTLDDLDDGPSGPKTEEPPIHGAPV
jgi:transcriptional regulator with XRE-family HTH domain